MDIGMDSAWTKGRSTAAGKEKMPGPWGRSGGLDRGTQDDGMMTFQTAAEPRIYA